MSSEFTQFTFPCKDCLVLAACKEKPRDEDNIKHLFNDNLPCLALPKIPSNLKSHHKVLLECLINLSHSAICRMQKTEDPKNSSETNNKIPMQYVMLIGRMIDLLQWIINSYSWDNGVLEEFDKFEVKNKLKSLLW